VPVKEVLFMDRRKTKKKAKSKYISHAKKVTQTQLKRKKWGSIHARVVAGKKEEPGSHP
jgi:hypothetical protein